MLRDPDAIQQVKVRQLCLEVLWRCQWMGSLCVLAAKLFAETPELCCEV